MSFPLRTAWISAIIACVSVFPGTALGGVIYSISGTYGQGPKPSGSSLILDGSPTVTGSAPSNSLVGTSVSELEVTLGSIAYQSTMGSDLYYAGKADLSNTADSTATIVITQGSNKAVFTITNPVDITIQQPADGSFTSNGTISQSNVALLTSSTIANLTDIGSSWDLRISFQGNFRTVPGNPGTFTFANDYTSSGSFTIAQHGAFSTPEPASIVTFGILGVVGMATVSRKKRQVSVA